MHLKSLVKRNWVEGWLVFAGVVILIVQFVVAKHFLSDGGIDHTNIIGAPLDDTYIHCRFAENFLHGHGYSFNPGQIVSADTSPLWVVMIGIFGLITSHLDLVAFTLSAIAWLLLAPAVYRIARYVLVWEQSFSITAAICMLLSPRLLVMNLSGMETTFATLLVLIAIEIHVRSREMKEIRIREAVVLGLGIMLRPELYLLVMIVLADWLIVIMKKQVRLKELVKFVLPILVFGYVVFSIPYAERGSFLYHSSIVQGAGFRFPPDLFFIGRSFYLMLENIWWIVIFILFLIFPFRSRSLQSNSIIIFFVILLPIVQGFVAPQYRHFGRYEFLVFPLVIITAFGLLRSSMLSERGLKFFRGMQDSRRMLYLSIAAIILALPLAIKWTHAYGYSVRNINDQHLAVADWINQNTTDHSDKIASQDIGALGYFTKRNIIDLTGLVSPEFYLLQKDQSLVWKEARRQGANYFIIYQRLNPSFYQYAKDSLTLVKEFRVRPPLVSSADTVMSVFKVKGM